MFSPWSPSGSAAHWDLLYCSQMTLSGRPNEIAASTGYAAMAPGSPGGPSCPNCSSERLLDSGSEISAAIAAESWIEIPTDSKSCLKIPCLAPKLGPGMIWTSFSCDDDPDLS